MLAALGFDWAVNHNQALMQPAANTVGIVSLPAAVEVPNVDALRLMCEDCRDLPATCELKVNRDVDAPRRGWCNGCKSRHESAARGVVEVNAHPHEVAWEAQFAKLASYKAAHGDCNVLAAPQGWAEDPSLARWVNTQRTRKMRLDRGDASPGITAARLARLAALGFSWVGAGKSQAALQPEAWEAQFAKLEAYKEQHGDCDVPPRWAADPRLANWVRTQRACKRRLDRGEANPRITASRAARLAALGFAWSLR